MLGGGGISINEKYDFLIITNKTRKNLEFAKTLQTGKIISQTHLYNLFDFRFKTRLNLRNKAHHESQNLLSYVRMINKKHYDKYILSVDFNKARLKTTLKNQRAIDEFFLENKIFFKKVIAVNIFGSSYKVWNFPKQSWFDMVLSLSKEFQNYAFIFTSSLAQAHEFKPLKALCQTNNRGNIFFFTGSEDILDLVELSSRLDLLISLDTGNIHIADNLQIPTLGLYTQDMLKRWSGGSYGGYFKAFVIPRSKTSAGYEKDFYDFIKSELLKL